MKKLVLFVLLSVSVLSCNNSLNKLSEASLLGMWGTYTQYDIENATTITFSIDSITDLIFFEEMTLIQYEIDEDSNRLSSSSWVDRSNPDRDTIRSKVEKILGSNSKIPGNWTSNANETCEFKYEGSEYMVNFDGVSDFQYRILDFEIISENNTTDARRLQYYSSAGWTDFAPANESNMRITSFRNNSLIRMESESQKKYNFRMSADLGSTNSFDLEGIKTRKVVCNYEFRVI